MAPSGRKTGGGTGTRRSVRRPGATSRTAKRPAAKAGARKARLDRIRKEIQKGNYETEGKLRIAISRLIDDVLARAAKRRAQS